MPTSCCVFAILIGLNISPITGLAPPTEPVLSLLSGVIEVAPPPRLVGEPVTLPTPTGTLHGTIDLPPGDGPWPVVVLHPGSGPTDRDGNSRFTKNDSLKLLGRALAARGIAVLRIDKRGIGASAKAMVKEADLRIDTYADDLTAWVTFLRADRRFQKVGLIGHSEGALIALIAAGKAKPDAIVSLCGMGRPFQETLRTQLKSVLSKELNEKADSIMVDLTAGKKVAEVPAELSILFRPSVQPYLISVFAADPESLAKAYRGPLLVVGGTTDIQIPVADADRLVSAHPGAGRVVIEGMNHILKAVEKTDRAVQLPTYADPSLPLHPALVDAIVGFLKKRLESEQGRK